MSAAASSILSISDLTVRRGHTTILNQVDWRVGRGEHWVILGANGSGKTSLLRALTGYLAPTAGEIYLLGEHFGESDWRELRLHIGVVMNSFSALIPVCETALDTVVSGKFAQLDLWARVTSADRAAGRRLLRLVRASHLARREWQFLSQGERQRVLIARALMAKPRLLILDEPCAGLDPAARDEFLRLIESLTRRRLAPALVLVTHHVEEITPGFTHALLLKSGRVLAAGRRAKVLTSRNLSSVFNARVRLASAGKSLRITIARK
jgi:iron complex transport system ATP-binding protein